MQALLGDDPSLEPVRKLLIARTEGNPLFLEESVRALVETGRWWASEAPIVWSRPLRRCSPADRTGDPGRAHRSASAEKQLLQAAAVIGKDIPFDLLKRSRDGEDELHRGLAGLQAAEMVYETRLFPDLEYTFKHALTHEVAYASLLHDRRRPARPDRRRGRAAVRDRLNEHIERLAHHAVRAETWDKAVVYLREAGTKALRHSANADALSYLTRGLETVETLPEGAARERHKLALLLALGPAIQAMKGLGAPEAERVFSRAQELSERVGDTGAAFQALWGQWMFSAGQALMAPARRIGGELLTLAERTQDRALLLEAHHAMWATSFWLGELSAAERHIEQGMSLYDREQHRSLAFFYGGHDPGACCRWFRAWTHWLFGRPVQAVTASKAAVALAEQIAHPPTIAIGLTWACALLYFERNPRATGQLARRLIDLATERDLPPGGWRERSSMGGHAWRRERARRASSRFAKGSWPPRRRARSCRWNRSTCWSSPTRA